MKHDAVAFPGFSATPSLNPSVASHNQMLLPFHVHNLSLINGSTTSRHILLFSTFVYYCTVAQGDKDETTKEEISSAVPMTGNMMCGKDADSSSSEVTESIKLNQSNLLHHPSMPSSNTDLDQSMLHSAGNIPPVPDLSVSPESLQMLSTAKLENGWNMSTELLRPRIFCLEHAVQIKELLQPKGGASMLIICHSGDNFTLFTLLFKRIGIFL